MNIRSLILAVALAAPGLSAWAGQERIDYAAYAGDPIPEFRFTQIHHWQRISDRSLVLWTRPGTAYYLTLRNDCDALLRQVPIEIGGVQRLERRLRAGTGYLHVGDMRCRVATIRPIDLKRLKRARATAGR